MKIFYIASFATLLICIGILALLSQPNAIEPLRQIAEAPPPTAPVVTVAPATSTATAEPSATTAPTNTSAPTSAPTATQQPPTSTPVPTATQPPTATAEPAGPRTNAGANLRRGPSTAFDVAGAMPEGQPLSLVAAAGDWYQLEGGQWIAAFLVEDAPAGLPIVEVPLPTVAPAPTPVPVVATEPVQSTSWRDSGVQACDKFEWRIYDVRRAKEVWWFGKGRIAQGEWLITYIHYKNISPGDAQPATTKWRINGNQWSSRGTNGASYMQNGGYNHPTVWLHPGQEMGIVAAWDIAPGLPLNFSMAQCGQFLTLGDWDNVQEGAITAN